MHVFWLLSSFLEFDFLTWLYSLIIIQKVHPVIVLISKAALPSNYNIYNTGGLQGDVTVVSNGITDFVSGGTRRMHLDRNKWKWLAPCQPQLLQQLKYSAGQGSMTKNLQRLFHPNILHEFELVTIHSLHPFTIKGVLPIFTSWRLKSVSDSDEWAVDSPVQTWMTSWWWSIHLNQVCCGRKTSKTCRTAALEVWDCPPLI